MLEGYEREKTHFPESMKGVNDIKIKRLEFEDLIAMIGFSPSFALIGVAGGMMITFGTIFVFECLRFAILGVAAPADYSRIYMLGAVLGALLGIAGGEYYLMTRT